MEKEKGKVGRPRVSEERKAITIAFSLPKSLATALDEAAEMEGMGRSEYLREMLTASLAPKS